MTDKIDLELQDRLRAVLGAGISEDAMNGINKDVERIRVAIEDDVIYRLKDDLAPALATWVADMAQRAVEMVLEGNEDQMRRYLSCEKRGDDGEYIGWTGRSDGVTWGALRRPEEWHPVIHGKLFETGAIALRKKIVDAHRDVLVTERIKDLEDQIASLVAQVNKATHEKNEMWERFRHVA